VLTRNLTTRPDTSPLGLRMTQRMEELRLSDRDVADKAGLSYDTVRTIRREPGKRPSQDTIEKLAKVLEVTTSWLSKGESSKGPSSTLAAASDPIQEAKDTLARKLRVPPERIRIIVEY
jgi:transcriptional regulator with XRE-family HTH domain